MKIPQPNRQDLKEIGFSLIRVWSRHYRCFGYYDSKKKTILCYCSDEKGNVLDGAIGFGMDWPLKIWDPDKNFEIIKK